MASDGVWQVLVTALPSILAAALPMVPAPSGLDQVNKPTLCAQVYKNWNQMQLNSNLWKQLCIQVNNASAQTNCY